MAASPDPIATAFALRELGAVVQNSHTGDVIHIDFRPMANGANDEEVAQLPVFTKLRELYLAKTGVTNEGLKIIGGLRSLRLLDLSATAVSDAGLVHLENLDQLQMLILSGTRVTREGVKPLRQKLLGTRIVLL